MRSTFVLAALGVLLLACGGSSNANDANDADVPAGGGSGGSTTAGASAAGAPAAGAAGTNSAVGGSAAAGSSAGGAIAGGFSDGLGGASSDTGGATLTGGAPTGAVVLGGARPTTLHVPPQYDGTKALPLVVMLHGYSATGALESLYLGLPDQADTLGFFLLAPDGTKDTAGEEFWNATDACCNFYGSTVDDDGYLVGLVKEAEMKVQIDPKQVYFTGHSNGGFMAYRMACNHADLIAAIGVLAGDMWEDDALCQPSNPVSVLHVQGTADTTILYNGGLLVGKTYPGAKTSTGDWVTFDKATSTADTSAPALDLEATIIGPETSVSKWTGGENGTEVELWSIAGGSHIPDFTPAFAPDFTGWLLAHPKQ